VDSSLNGEQIAEEYDRTVTGSQVIGQHLASIEDACRIIEAQCSYLEGNEEVNATELRKYLAGLRYCLEEIARENDTKVEAVKSNVDEVKLRVAAAKKLQGSGKPDDAYKIYRQVIDQYPGHPLATEAHKEAKNLYNKRVEQLRKATNGPNNHKQS